MTGQIAGPWKKLVMQRSEEDLRLFFFFLTPFSTYRHAPEVLLFPSINYTLCCVPVMKETFSYSVERGDDHFRIADMHIIVAVTVHST